MFGHTVVSNSSIIARFEVTLKKEKSHDLSHHETSQSWPISFASTVYHQDSSGITSPLWMRNLNNKLHYTNLHTTLPPRIRNVSPSRERRHRIAPRCWIDTHCRMWCRCFHRWDRSSEYMPLPHNLRQGKYPSIIQIDVRGYFPRYGRDGSGNYCENLNWSPITLWGLVHNRVTLAYSCHRRGVG